MGYCRTEIPPQTRGAQRSLNVGEVLNGIFYVLWTGCQWKALPKDLPPKSTVHDYLDLLETPRHEAQTSRMVTYRVKLKTFRLLPLCLDRRNSLVLRFPLSPL